MSPPFDPEAVRARWRSLFRLAGRALLHPHEVLEAARLADAPAYEFSLRGPDRGLLRRRWRWELFEDGVPFVASRSLTGWLAVDHLLLASERRARAALGGGGRSGAGRRLAWAFGHEHLFVTEDGVAFWTSAYAEGWDDDDGGEGGERGPGPLPVGGWVRIGA